MVYVVEKATPMMSTAVPATIAAAATKDHAIVMEVMGAYSSQRLVIMQVCHQNIVVAAIVTAVPPATAEAAVVVPAPSPPLPPPPPPLS
jgi:hypothetical protein